MLMMMTWVAAQVPPTLVANTFVISATSRCSGGSFGWFLNKGFFSNFECWYILDILIPGGHPSVVEKNVKFAMACHNCIHSPVFKDHDCVFFPRSSFYGFHEFLLTWEETQGWLYPAQGQELGHACQEVLPDPVIFLGCDRLQSPW